MGSPAVNALSGTAGPAGANKAVAAAKAALNESHKHFGDNPDYAPKPAAKSASPKHEFSDASYSHVREAHEPMGGTTAEALNARQEMGKGVNP